MLEFGHSCLVTQRAAGRRRDGKFVGQEILCRIIKLDVDRGRRGRRSSRVAEQEERAVKERRYAEIKRGYGAGHYSHPHRLRRFCRLGGVDGYCTLATLPGDGSISRRTRSP